MLHPKPHRITEHGEKLLVVLRRLDRWSTRTQIAEAAGKDRLNLYDVATLDLLAEEGLIEARKVPGRGRGGYLWEYRSSAD